MRNQDLSRYTDLDRLCGGHMSHIEVANKVRMLMRNDLDHEAICTMARDRIMHLAGEVERMIDVLGDLLHELPTPEEGDAGDGFDAIRRAQAIVAKARQASPLQAPEKD